MNKELLIPFMLTFGSIMADVNKKWEDRIKKEWKESKNYPRKKKKQIRKSLLLDWNICHSTNFMF